PGLAFEALIQCPHGAWIPRRLADPSDQPLVLKRIQPPLCRRPAQVQRLRDVTGTQRALRAPQRVQYLLAALWKSSSHPRIESRQRSEHESYAAAGLPVDGIRQADPAHLCEDPLYALAEFLAYPEIGADPRDSGVSREAADF